VVAAPEAVKAQTAAPEGAGAGSSAVSGTHEDAGAGTVTTGDAVLGLDQAIKETAAYFTAHIPAGRRIALLEIDSESAVLSAYIIQELWNYLEASGGFTMIDRQNVSVIQEELETQADGWVSEESAQRIGHLYGPQTIIYGSVGAFDGNYRLALYATAVEQGVSSQYAKTVRPDARFRSDGVDARIDRAVYELAKGIRGRLTVAPGKICLHGYQSVSAFSNYLKKNIVNSAARRKSKYRMLAEGAEGPAAGGQFPVQALIEGDYTPRGDRVEVQLRLVSADAEVLGAGTFTLAGEELEGVWTIPREAELKRYEEKQRIIAPYDGDGNAFTFTVTPDRPDCIYYDNDTMSFTIYAEQDCYFKVSQVDIYNNIQVIYPRSARDDNFIPAGGTRTLPDTTKFRIRVPEGEEYILVAAYTHQPDPAPGQAAPLSSAAIAQGLKARILVVEDPESAADMDPVATARFSYVILSE
jgi:hypothetical protein